MQAVMDTSPLQLSYDLEEEVLRDAPLFEVYLDDKCKTRPEDLRTDICIPIE
jgi:DNA gyrase inhibitor GyrI